MKLCYDDVKNWNICLPMLLHFRRNYSEPTEIIDILKDDYFELEDLQFAFDRLGMRLSPEERAAYFKRINVDEKSAPFVYNSENIVNSKIISDSENILNSERVNRSSEIEDSEYIFGSSIVKKSSDIYYSKYITNSSLIIKSLNISNSNNIYNSNYVMDSHGIVGSGWINESYNIIDSSRVVNSAFCRHVINLDHCLFCSDIQDKSYHIFNQPASEWIYKFTIEQLNHYLKYELNLMKIVRTDMYPVDPILVSPSEWFATYPDTFIKWLSTIPLYDKNLLLGLTFDKRFNE